MKSSEKKIELAPVDNLFTTEQERQEASEERVVRIPLTQLHYFKGYPAMQTEIPFTGQPYRFKDDDPKMQETLDSVKKRGVRAPGLVRPDPDGGYEIISGHRRHRASELAGLEDMPVIIRDMTDEEAVIEMVDANIQREKVMPSEKAWAYRMKLTGTVTPSAEGGTAFFSPRLPPLFLFAISLPFGCETGIMESGIVILRRHNNEGIGIFVETAVEDFNGSGDSGADPVRLDLCGNRLYLRSGVGAYQYTLRPLGRIPAHCRSQA